MIWSALGSGPSDTSNSWNCEGLMTAPGSAVHVILVIASVISPSSDLIGVESFVVSVVAVQPATGRSDTDAIGVSGGRFTSTFVVFALSVSFGTRKATLVYPPWTAELGLTVTCAEAGTAKPSAPAAAAASTTPAR